MDAKVTWHGKLSFTGTANTGFQVPLGASEASGGDEDGFQPMELFAIGLAGCAAMDVISILGKKGQKVTDFNVEAHMERASVHPKVFTSAVLTYLVSGHALSETAVVRSIELSITRYCPAQAMLGKLIPITTQYKIFEDEGDGTHTLLKSGAFTVPGQQVVA